MPEQTDERARQARLRGVRKIVKRIVYLLLLGGGVAALAVAMRPRPMVVEVATVTRGHLRVTIDEDGQARIKDRYVVSAPIAGSLARITLDAGDAIQQGTVLSRIAPLSPALLDARTRATAGARLAQALAAQSQSRAQIVQAKTSAEFATHEAARTRVLFGSGAGSQQQVEQAELTERRTAQEYKSLRFGARVADFEVEMARAALDRLPGARAGSSSLDVPAPVGGRVLKVLHKNEGVVQPGTPLLEIGDEQDLEVVVDVLTSDAPRIRAGAPVLLDGWGGPTLQGRVRRVEPSAFTRLSALGVDEQRVNLLIDLLDPHERFAALGDGYRVEAHVIVWEGDVLRVPMSALFRKDTSWALFRVEGGVARTVQVELGERTALLAEVVRGLSQGDVVILHPSDQVLDGVKVVAQ